MKHSVVMGIAIALALTTASAQAETFPTGPVTIINPYSAGGPADLIARTVAEGMSSRLGQPVVVENRPGAATAIAATAVAQAKPDGQTLLIAGSPTHVVTPAIQQVNYDGIKDFAPVAMVALVPNVLVVAKKSGITTVDALVAKAKAEANAVSFASVGNGSLPHLSSVFFSQQAGLSMVHIPYKGAAPAVVDLLAGNVDMGFLNAPPLVAHFDSGDLLPLAIAASKRSKKLPDVPTMDELGYKEFEMSTWYGISAPAGTSADVVKALDDAIASALQTAEIADKLGDQGVEVFYMPSAEFATYLAKDAKRMLSLIDAAGLEKK